MADAKWYPELTGNPKADLTNRKIYDDIYALQRQVTALAGRPGNNSAPLQGLSATVSFSYVDGNNNAHPISVVAGNKSFSRLTFQEGRLVGIS